MPQVSVTLSDTRFITNLHYSHVLGYRMFDCAKFYGNEQFLGKALKDSGIPRDELFLVSKVWTDAVYSGDAAIRAQVPNLPRKPYFSS